MLITAHFNLMVSDPKNGQVSFDKKIFVKLPTKELPEGELVTKEICFIPHRGSHITLDKPNLKKYIVWNTNLVLIDDQHRLEIEILDPDETSVYPNMRG